MKDKLYVVKPVKQQALILGVYTTLRKAKVCVEKCAREGTFAEIVVVTPNRRNHSHEIVE